jgi:hypothetical protein
MLGFKGLDLLEQAKLAHAADTTRYDLAEVDGQPPKFRAHCGDEFFHAEFACQIWANVACTVTNPGQPSDPQRR